MSGIATTIYRSAFKRTSTMAVVVIGMAFFYERGTALISDYIFDSINKGVSLRLINNSFINGFNSNLISIFD